MTQIETAAPKDMAELGRKLRLLAAVSDQAGYITFTLSCARSRDLAHLIDGGGFAGAVDQVVSGRVEAAVATARAEENVARDAWVARCQGVLADARAHLRKARLTLLVAGLVWTAALLTLAVVGW